MNNITAGSLVKPNYNFRQERIAFPMYNYPNIENTLTVKRIARDESNNVMLWFSDWQIPIPLAACCFDLVQDTEDGQLILDEVHDILNGIC